ncbi:MAG TPA: hypothetical protein P5013_06580 [Methanoregula sp.]|nr:hypothetical protein [Methanoregula sp.]
MTPQVFLDPWMIDRITQPPLFTEVGKAPGSPAGFGEPRIPQTGRISGCRSGWFP